MHLCSFCLQTIKLQPPDYQHWTKSTLIIS